MPRTSVAQTPHRCFPQVCSSAVALSFRLTLIPILICSFPQPPLYIRTAVDPRVGIPDLALWACLGYEVLVLNAANKLDMLPSWYLSPPGVDAALHASLPLFITCIAPPPNTPWHQASSNNSNLTTTTRSQSNPLTPSSKL